MANRYYSDINLTGQQLIGALLNPVSADPSGLGVGDKGRVWFNTSSNRLKYWNGTAAIDVIDRSTHQGTQLASTISDLAATVKAYRLDEFAAPTNPVTFNSQRLINLADPTSAQDAATKNYVDVSLANVATGMTLKGVVKAAATTNVSLSAPGATIDGVSFSNGDIVLLTAQTTGSQNGPYVWSGASSALVRAANWDTSAEAVIGSFWIVAQGTYADTFALLTNDSPITLGSTVPAFVFRGTAGATYTAGNGISLASNVITALAAASGGVVVDSSGIKVDSALVGFRKLTAIPASSGGGWTISGSTATYNHALNTTAVDVVIRAGSSPYGDLVAGQQAWMDVIASDANNIVVTLPAAPAANQWLLRIDS